jgi:hypothetical protein
MADFAGKLVIFKASFLEYVKSLGIPDGVICWIDKMVDYTAAGGKMNRGMMVVNNSEKEEHYALGWCVELVQKDFFQRVF